MTRLALELWLAGVLLMVFALITSAFLGGGKKYRDPLDYLFALLWPLSLFSARGRLALISIIKGTQS
jgi:hypothetical protein